MVDNSISKYIPQQFYDDRAAFIATKFQEIGGNNPNATIRDFIDEIVKPFSNNPREIDAFTLGYICRLLEHQNTIERVSNMAETLQGLLNGCIDHLVNTPQCQDVLHAAALTILQRAIEDEAKK